MMQSGATYSPPMISVMTEGILYVLPGLYWDFQVYVLVSRSLIGACVVSQEFLPFILFDAVTSYIPPTTIIWDSSHVVQV